MKRGLLEALLVATGAMAVVACSEDPEGGGGGGDATVTDRGPIEDRGTAGEGGGGAGGAEPDADVGGMGGGGVGGEGGVVPQPQCNDGIDNDGDGLIDFPADPGCVDANDDDERDPAPLPQCNDGIDNDGDGLFDLEDTDCISSIDPTEDGANPVTVCSNRADDDGDGLIDFPNDPGCRGAGDDSEADAPVAPACSNGLDDDADGLIDFPNDPGCQGRGDQDETSPRPLPACADGLDNDGDGAIDYPIDSGCTSASDRTEESTCGALHNPIDLNTILTGDVTFVDGTLVDAPETLQGSCGGNAGPEQIYTYRVDGALRSLTFTTLFPETAVPTVLYVRRTCDQPQDIACNRGVAETPGTSVTLTNPEPGTYFVVVDTSNRQIGPGAFRLGVEVQKAPQCRDLIDNDDDGLIDLSDPGCASPEGEDETDPAVLPECADGIDNDGDGLIDYPADPDCAAAGGPREAALCRLNFPHLTRLEQAGGPVVLSAEPDAGLSAGTCGGATFAEHVIQLTLNQRSDVFLEFDGVQAPPLAVYGRAVCDDSTSEFDCTAQVGLTKTFRNLQAGVHFLVVDHLQEVPAVPYEATVRVVGLVRQCNDEVDNDGDALIDLMDPGCFDSMDDSEIDPPTPPQCADGIDNDGNGLIDYPNDPGCRAAGDDDERLTCSAVDNVISVGIDGGIFDYDTAGQGNNYSTTCGGAGAGPEQAFELNLDSAASVEVEILDADYDTVLHARADCDSAATQIACDDDGAGNLRSLLRFNRLEAGRYFFFADGFSAGANGPARIDFRVTPIPPPACSDGRDNDGDGLIDVADPGCASPFDDDETDPATPPVCADGIDNDGDGLIDFPADPGCFAAGGNLEDDYCAFPAPIAVISGDGGEFTFRNRDVANLARGTCAVGQGLEQVVAIQVAQLSDVSVTVTTEAGTAAPAVIYLRRDCDDAASELGCSATGGRLNLRELSAGTYFAVIERTAAAAPPSVDWRAVVTITSRIVACNNEVDDDEDGLVDLYDPGCTGPFDTSEIDPDEVPACADGIDNDGDGLIDYPEDPDCRAAGGRFEDSACLESSNLISVDDGGGRFDYDTTGLPNAYQSTCGASAASPEQAFRLDLARPSIVEVEIVQAAYDTVLFARAECDVAGSSLGCNDDGGVGNLSLLRFNRLEPGTYFFFADGYTSFDGTQRSGPGVIEFRITAIVPPICDDGIDNDDDGLIDLFDPGCTGPTDQDETDPDEVPACADGIDNDGDGLIDYPEDPDCAAAGGLFEEASCQSSPNLISVDDAGGRFNYDTTGLPNAYLSTCGGSANSPEQAFRLQLTQPSIVEVEIVQAAYDTVLFARAECDVPATSLGCDDDGGQGNLSLLRFARLEAGTYFFFADGYTLFDGTGRQGPGVIEFRVTAIEPPACSDGIDNDDDGLIDAFDPGCVDARDDDETDPAQVPECADGVDNDGDGLIDYPEDPGCRAAGGLFEEEFCSFPAPLAVVGGEGGSFTFRHLDERSLTAGSCAAGQGLEQVVVVQIEELSDLTIEVRTDTNAAASTVIYLRSDCDSAESELSCSAVGGRLARGLLEPGTYFAIIERGAFAAVPAAPWTVNVTITSRIGECNDEVDNDDDGLVDLFDPGCTGPLDLDETDPAVVPECADGIDNDGDGFIDYPEDPECRAAGSPFEALTCAASPPVAQLGDAGGVVEVVTAGRPNNFQSGCSLSASNSGDAVVLLTLTAPATVEVEVTAADFDTLVYLRSVCEEVATELACNDDDPRDFGSDFAYFQVDLPAGVYSIIVDGWGAAGTNTGTATLRVTVAP